MKNKILTLVLAALMLVMALSLTACGGNNAVKIGVQSGTTGELFLRGDADWGFEGFANVSTQPYDNASLAVTDMKNGNVKYVVIDAAVGKSLAANDSAIKVIDYALTSEDFGIGVDKNQPELLAEINRILTEKADFIAELYEKYSNVNEENAANWSGTTVTSATYDSSKNQLVLATNAAFPPYEFTVGNAFAGIEMEMAQMIADELGMELVIEDMAFESVVTSIGKNGIDVAFSGLTINPAREKVINFTQPFETGSYQVILAMKDDTTFDSCTTADEVLAKLAELKG